MNRARWLWILAPILGLFASSCVVTTETCDLDSDGDGWCDDEDDYPLDAACWMAPDPVCDGGCTDTDGDGYCDVDDCYPNDAALWDCPEGCTPADNYCDDPWYINYCDVTTGGMLGADCFVSCTTDARVYAQTCGGVPAVTGECLPELGSCGCWCEEAFDSCVNDYTVQYERDGVTYQVDCKEYCNGSCDATAGACLCP